MVRMFQEHSRNKRHFAFTESHPQKAPMTKITSTIFTYISERGQTILYSEIDPGGDSVLSLFFDNLSGYLVMDVADFEGAFRMKPWATTESDHHLCREGSERKMSFIDSTPQPSFRRRQISVHGGLVQDTVHPAEVEPDPPLPPKYQLVPATPSDAPEGMSNGPFRWQK